MSTLGKQRSIPALAVVSIVAALAAFAPIGALAVPGGVQVSDQGDCAVGPTNVNQLAAGQTAYVWLIFNSTDVTVRGYTYQITETGNTPEYDSGIVRVRFQECRTSKKDPLPTASYFIAKVKTPTTLGGYSLTVFDETGATVSSDNFAIV